MFYLSTINVFMYLANYIRLNIAFSVNLLIRYSSTPIQRQWNWVKHTLSYIRETTDIELFYPKGLNPQLIDYADSGYLFDPYKGISQTLMVVLLFHDNLSSKH